MLFMIVAFVAFNTGFVLARFTVNRQLDYLSGYHKGYHDAIDYAIKRIELRKEELTKKI